MKTLTGYQHNLKWHYVWTWCNETCYGCNAVYLAYFLFNPRSATVYYPQVWSFKKGIRSYKRKHL